MFFSVKNSLLVTECPDLMNTTEIILVNETDKTSMLRITMNGRHVGDMTTFSCPIGCERTDHRNNTIIFF